MNIDLKIASTEPKTINLALMAKNITIIFQHPELLRKNVLLQMYWEDARELLCTALRGLCIINLVGDAGFKYAGTQSEQKVGLSIRNAIDEAIVRKILYRKGTLVNDAALWVVYILKTMDEIDDGKTTTDKAVKESFETFWRIIARIPDE